MQLDEIQQIFFQECDEGLALAEGGLLACQDGSGDADTINTIFRAVHSIKGGAGAFGFAALQSFTHHFETVLDQVRSGEAAMTPPLLATLLKAFDTLSDHVAAIRGQGGAPDDRDMLAQLEAIAAGAVPAAPPEPAPAAAPANADLGFDLDAFLTDCDAPAIPSEPEPEAPSSAEPDWIVRLWPRRAALANGGEPLLLIRELVSMGGEVIGVNLSALPDLAGFDPEESYLGWTLRVPGDVAKAAIEEPFEFVGEACGLQIERDTRSGTPCDEVKATPVVVVEKPPVAVPAAFAGTERRVPDRRGADAQTIRVDLEKLDRLVNLVGELVITQAMLAQRLLNCGLASITELTDLDHLTRELQDSAMSIRAQPIKSVFSRVPRIVRELEAQTGKRVRLEVEGESTELDKTVVERIGEPLTHLIRNAVDHGLETPEERVAAGKSPEGCVRLSAEHRGGRILINVADDGKGIDRERVFNKAVERGLIPADAKLSDEEIDNLIFAPGFSTAAAVTSVSGRGVGMDVVRQNVHALGGRITITSAPGKGSTFTLALPLTLAIVDGMIVSVGDQTYIIPLTHIVESLRPQPGEVKSMGGGRGMLNVRGTYLPVHPIARQLGVAGAATEPTEAVLIVVETEGRGQAVLMVDAIRDQRQVVIKSLETNYRQIDGVAGATILGDGRVALILDVEGLVAACQGEPMSLARVA
jgi:two-component system chemotaxis sensor kinase CheA